MIRRSLNRLAWGTVFGIFFGLVFLGRLQRVIPEMSPPAVGWGLVWTSFLSLVAVWVMYPGHYAVTRPEEAACRRFLVIDGLPEGASDRFGDVH